MNFTKDDLRNQSLYEHALCFDPINQQRSVSSDGKLKFGAFKDVPGVISNPDGSFEFTYFAPEAKEVEVRGIGGSMPKTYEMKLADDMPGYFKATVSDVCPGFHYVEFLVDGVNAIHNQLPIGYGCSYAINFVDIPDPEFDYCMLKDIPHGTVHMEIYYSEITKRYRNCYVYTPASYRENSEKHYPVFYIQHGGGEDESGWLWQGKINYLMDNMIAEGLCEEMIVVMNCGYNFTEDENGLFNLGDIDNVFCKDCVPMIDERYRTIAKKEYRAIAGLSFGSVHAKMTAFGHTDVFSALGLLSGTMTYDTIHTKSSMSALGKFDYSALFKNAETFNKNMKLFFVGYGDEETRLVEENAPQAEKLISEGYNVVHKTFPGYHEWNVWRRCAFEMAKLLFKW